VITAKDLNENLFVTCPYVLDVFFIRDTIECDMPDRNVKALAVGTTFSSVTDQWAHVSENGSRQGNDLHISCGE
jgi:hypothetical protein